MLRGAANTQAGRDDPFVGRSPAGESRELGPIILILLSAPAAVSCAMS